MIDEYVEIKAELTPSQKEWQSTLKMAAENIVMMANSIKSLCLNIPALHAEATLQIGFILKLLSNFNCAGRFHSLNFTATNQVVHNYHHNYSSIINVSYLNASYLNVSYLNASLVEATELFSYFQQKFKIHHTLFLHVSLLYVL